MSEKVENKNGIGNPYHDEETGQFTSAGVSAVQEQLESENYISNKEYNLNHILSKYNNFYDFLNNEKSAHLIRDFVDNYGSVPSFMSRYGNLLKYASKQNIKINHNDELDKIGIDLMCFDGDIKDLTVENIYEKINFVDIKTTYKNRIKLMAVQLVGTGLIKDGLANPKRKVNNLFAFQFFDGLQNLNSKAIAKKMIFQDMYSNELKPNPLIKSSAYIIHKEDIYNLIYEHLPIENIEEAYNLVNDGLKRGRSQEEMFDKLCSYDSDMKISNPEPGYKLGVMDFDEGLSLLIKSDIRNAKKPIFEMSVQLSQNFIKEHFPDSELNYANIKNNKLII